MAFDQLDENFDRDDAMLTRFGEFADFQNVAEAEILVEQGIVETGEVPDPDQAAWHAQVPDKISENA